MASAPTPKQIAFIERLGGDPPMPSTRLEASVYINGLLAQAKAVQPASEPLEPGVYKHHGEIYRVKQNKAKTGVYATRLVEIGGTRVTEAGTFVNIDFVYAPGVVHHITPAEKLPLNEAAKLGVRYGRCLCCGRQLKDATSVLQGVGPVCVKHFAPAADQLELVIA